MQTWWFFVRVILTSAVVGVVALVSFIIFRETIRDPQSSFKDAPKKLRRGIKFSAWLLLIAFFGAVAGVIGLIWTL